MKTDICANIFFMRYKMVARLENNIFTVKKWHVKHLPILFMFKVFVKNVLEKKFGDGEGRVEGEKGG